MTTVSQLGVQCPADSQDYFVCRVCCALVTIDETTDNENPSGHAPPGQNK